MPATTSATIGIEGPFQQAIELVDLAMIDFLRGLSVPDDRDAFLRRLFESYETQARRLLGDLVGGLLEGKRQQIRVAAHGLKGSSMNVGAARLAVLLSELEFAADEAEFEVIRRHIEGVVDVHGMSVAPLRAALAA